MDAVTSARRRLADRALASDKRAGRYARHRAVDRQEAFIRRRWRLLVVLALLPDLLLPGL